MCRLVVLVTVVLVAATSEGRAEEPFGLDKLLSSGQHRARFATITHARDGWHLRGLVAGGLTFSSTEYTDELEADTMDLTTSTSAMSPMIEASSNIGRDLMDGSTVAVGPKFTVLRGEVMPGNERHLTLLVGFARR